jgi:FkbM family methyltransferase
MFKKNKYQKISYSQSGEDLIVDFVMTAIGIEKPTYFDIGAHHPYAISNTAFFHANGSNGVCVEPDPVLFRRISKVRKNDVCLNIGIGLGQEAEADFYIMSIPSLNTFSKEHALECESYGNVQINSVIKMPLVNINDIMQDNFKTTPNFVSLDVEGLDFEILKSFDFSKYRPEVFCIETLTYTENNTEEKLSNIIQFMSSMGYKSYADTYINTIFVDQEIWKNRKTKK